jgi:hypothetical protein
MMEAPVYWNPETHLAFPWKVIFIISALVEGYEEVCTTISVCKW